MGLRSDLHNILLGITAKVYFQPPESKELEYPCIVYKRDDVSEKYADDTSYILTIRYMVTVMDTNPDSLLPGKVGKLSNCSFKTCYTKDNLNHDVYNLYH